MPQLILSNLERRAVANLSIPRNAADLAHQLRIDPYVTVDQKVDDLLPALAEAGLVVKLGSRHESSGKLAAAVNAHKQARSMPEEKARIFERRLLVPRRAWRLDGEQWAMTDEGFATLHLPVAEERPPLTKAEVEAVIREELARVYKGDHSKEALAHEDLSLAQVLLESEWAEWAKSVAAAFEKETGEKILLPTVGGAGYSDATELLILDPENGKGSAYTETAPWFNALVTVAVTDADTGSTITEATYTGYARKSVAAADMNSAASGAATNANDIIHAACTGSSSTIIGGAKCVASTVGRLIKYYTCASVTVSATQTPAKIAAGQFSTTLD